MIALVIPNYHLKQLWGDDLQSNLENLANLVSSDPLNARKFFWDPHKFYV